MKSLVVLFMLISLPALGFGPARPQVPNDAGGSDAADPYETRFRDLGAQYGAVFFNKSILYSFRNFYFSSTAGVCYYSGGSQPNRVELNQNMWSSGSDTFKEMLMFHELGHCLLGRGHTNSQNSGRPDSLMNSYLFSERTYQQYRDEYLRELYQASFRSSYAPLRIGRSSEEEEDGGCQFHGRRVKTRRR